MTNRCALAARIFQRFITPCFPQTEKEKGHCQKVRIIPKSPSTNGFNVNLKRYLEYVLASCR